MGVFGASFVVRIGAYRGGDRSYRTALDTAQACGEIADGSGSQFCPDTA
jgi:HD-GYP domain-containing protein (c-di-GMP phosphodiesterase class II)